MHCQAPIHPAYATPTDPDRCGMLLDDNGTCPRVYAHADYVPVPTSEADKDRRRYAERQAAR